MERRRIDRPQPEDLPLDVLFEDRDIIAVDKPAGMAVHPSPGYESGTVVNALLAACPSIRGVGSEERPGIVHRLDVGTSGVLLAAKTARAYHALREMFSDKRGVVKKYLAVIHGAPHAKTGTLETLIGRKPWDPRRMAVDVPDGKPAITHWRVLARHGGISLAEFTIETGRTHQIRVHAAHLGCPVAGDPLYGAKEKDARMRPRPERPLLHAAVLGFRHPFTGGRIEISAPPPPDIVYAG